MSYSAHGRINRGAYDRPVSGVGVEFQPLGAPPDGAGLTLHESGYLPDNADWNFPSVYSPFWRLQYNRHPGHCMLFGERMVELTPRHIVLVPPHVLFHCLGANPVPTCWLIFSFTRNPEAEQPVPILLRPRDTELCLIRDLSRLIERDPACAPSEAILRNSLALLQVVLARRELAWQAPLPDRLQRVCRHIEEHLGEPMPNPRLARLAGMSVEGLVRAFRRQFGTTPARHVLQTRVREAARRLLAGGETIDEIAWATGFPNRAYFSRVFKAVTGEPPATFRARHTRPADFPRVGPSPKASAVAPRRGRS